MGTTEAVAEPVVMDKERRRSEGGDELQIPKLSNKTRDLNRVSFVWGLAAVGEGVTRMQVRILSHIPVTTEVANGEHWSVLRARATPSGCQLAIRVGPENIVSEAQKEASFLQEPVGVLGVDVGRKEGGWGC
ncbi:hypothetical protein EOD39_6678 [Acipenser ruthenus]|uniref:Uncharacterized protein n=1 Tax=Acipenser ruthenus TaxID=7906 RepID=A0A444U9F1_ACIRT|nr:hypothetical protein EOD39_6678 [Acipenser ruthenus]